MNIQKYEAYFHDGTLVEIYQKENNIVISMISSVIYRDEMKDPMLLSYDNKIKGKLHLDKVTRITVDGEITSLIEMLYDSGEIFDLEIEEHKVTLVVIWQTHRPLMKVEEDSRIEIMAEDIYWESIQNMVDPFWFKEPAILEFASRPHYHHLNPDAKDKSEKYFDKNGKMVAQGSIASCLAPSKLNTIPPKEVPFKFIPEIPISEYALEFHDGELLEIEQTQDNIVMTITSAEIKPESISTKDASLIKGGRIKGKLHFEGVLFITKNSKAVSELKMEAELGDIFYIEFISSNHVEISITWESFFPAYQRLKSSSIEIGAQKIYWEPVI